MTKDDLIPRAFGVLIRISPQYIDKADIVLRAGEPWTTAQKDLAKGKTGVLYIAVIGQGADVQYKACLKEVLLIPKQGEPNTDRLWKLTPSEIQERGFRDETGQDPVTLYRLTDCKGIKPFPMTELIKRKRTPLESDRHISDKFTSSYVLVEPLSE